MTRTLEVAIGLGGTYLFLSIIVLAMVEGVSGFLNRRGKNLQDALEAMLTKGVATQLLAHPIVQTLGRAGNNGKPKVPSYLGPTMFSQAMTELIARGRDAKTDLAGGYQAFLASIDDENQRKHVRQLVGEKVESVEELQRRLEAWFDSSMDRLSGAYKRNTQWFSRGFAIALVLALNVNTITMAEVLWNDPEARAAAVKEADARVRRCAEGDKGTPAAAPPQPTQAGQPCPDLIATVGEEIPFPIQGRFWHGTSSIDGFLTTLLGLLLSIWAVSLGAPFWFDTLRKISGGIQQAGPRPARDGKK
ncbi:MAG: hypothetical protein K8M05_29335 [Deltaproteobacteria bacterium]|nr:hypothetical protein [Kofleriaceae bacterium]